MNIDNLDRIELTLIKKIESYWIKYYKGPKVIFFDFPRVSDPSKMMSVTALIEDSKSGHTWKQPLEIIINKLKFLMFR